MRTIAQKLQIKPGDRVYTAGGIAELRGLIEPLPVEASYTDAADGAAAAILYAHDRADLDQRLDEQLPGLINARAVWVAYPKGNRTDINRDIIARRVEDFGWVVNSNISLGDVWSAVRMRAQD